MAINSEACANLRIRRDAGICSSVHDWPVAGDSGWHSDAVLAVVPGLTTQAVRRVHCFLRLQRPGSLVLQYTTRLITMDKPGSRSSGDWISNLKVLVTTLQATAMAAPIPCLQSVFAGAMLVLDLIERVAKNETDLVYLADSVVNMTSLLTDELKPGGIGADSRFGELCADYVRYLAQIVHELNKTLAWKSKFWFRKYLKAKSIRDNVDDFTRHLNDLRANLTLAAVVGSHFQGASTDRRVQDVQSTLTRISQNSLIQTPSPNTQSNLNGIGIQGNIEEDILVLKPSELELEFETENRSVLTLTSRGAETPDNRAQVVVRTYGATLGHGKATTVRIYEGDRANQIWEKDLQMFAAHLRIPGVAQLYGMCTSLRLQALVFHDELVPIDIYAANISSPARSVDFELSLIRNFAVCLLFSQSPFTYISDL
ncbi:hypothetical protein B0H10DRAFT_338669 [Mycena sp. CBHHK59/15]|nr:hypothetical protein B0H10DRAFT_338669 [Mycena sp. CBHHK59/15]